jgi:hypothetical protein
VSEEGKEKYCLTWLHPKVYCPVADILSDRVRRKDATRKI